MFSVALKKAATDVRRVVAQLLECRSQTITHPSDRITIFDFRRTDFGIDQNSGLICRGIRAQALQRMGVWNVVLVFLPTASSGGCSLMFSERYCSPKPHGADHSRTVCQLYDTRPPGGRLRLLAEGPSDGAITESPKRGDSSHQPDHCLVSACITRLQENVSGSEIRKPQSNHSVMFNDHYSVLELAWLSSK